MDLSPVAPATNQMKQLPCVRGTNNGTHWTDIILEDVVVKRELLTLPRIKPLFPNTWSVTYCLPSKQATYLPSCISHTMALLQTAQKGKRMNTLQNYYIQLFRHNNTIIQEQAHTGNSPLFQVMYDAQARGADT